MLDNAVLTRRNAERIVVALVALLAVCCWAYSAHSILTSSPEQRVQFIPDDAYYYLSLARSFVNQGQWSFDSGVSLTSGFHLLHAYGLAAIYSLTHASAEQFVSYGIALSFMLAVPAVLLATFLAVRAGRLLASLVLLLFALSRNVSLNTVSAVEWSWVTSLSALYCLAFWATHRDRRKGALVVLPLAGFLGSLARTDFGLLPASLAAASIPALRASTGWGRVRSAFAGLGGAFAGVVVNLGHNWLATGQCLQSSARMKSLWMGTYGPSLRPIASVVFSLFGRTKVAFLFVGLLALVVLVCGVHRFAEAWNSACSANEATATADAQLSDATLWFGSGLAIAGYLAFYSLNPAGVQHWYTAGVVVPIFLVVNLPFLNVHWGYLGHVAVLVVLFILLAMQVPVFAALPTTPEWPHQLALLHAGHYLHERRFEAHVGSWNAGIINYYEGGHVINLDGVVNNDIYKYARSNELAAYVDERQIEYIVDFVNVLSSEDLRRRGGYDSPAFLRRLVPLKRFDNRSDGWHRLTLYRVRPSEVHMLEQHCREGPP